MVAKLLKADYLVLSIATYVLLLLAKSFYLDSNDVVELIPVMKKILHPNLYPHDFYIQFISNQWIYERSIFVYLMAYIIRDHFYLLYAFHAVFSVWMIYGIINIISIFIPNRQLIFITLITILLFLSYTAVGDSDWYMNCVSSSVLASGFAIWSLYFFLQKKEFASFILILFSLWIHISIGIQWILFYGIWGVRESIIHKKWILFNTSYILMYILSIPYILILYLNTQGGNHRGDEMFSILEFRVGHHFLIQYSKISALIVYFFLYAIGFYYWKKNNKKLYALYFLQGIGLIIYICFTLFFQSESILKTQWLRTTIWIEIFSTIAISCIVQDYLIQANRKKWILMMPIFSFLLYFTLIIFFSFRKDPWQGERNLDEERKIATYCKVHTPDSSLFVTPASFTLFKTVAERSNWVDYKAIAHSPEYLSEWYARIQKIYGISLEDRRKHRDLISQADSYLHQIDAPMIRYLNEQHGITHFIIPNPENKFPELLQEIYRSKNYSVFSVY